MECRLHLDNRARNQTPPNQDRLAIHQPTSLRQFMNNTPGGSKVSKFVKDVSDTKLEGYPAYDIHWPGPLISDPKSRTNGNFFDGYFGIWLDNPIPGPQCRPIRTHEVTSMLGLSKEHLCELNQLSPTHVIERLRTVPGRHGLETLFRRLRQAEVLANDVRTPQLDVACHHHVELDMYQPAELRTTTLFADWVNQDGFAKNQLRAWKRFHPTSS